MTSIERNTRIRAPLQAVWAKAHDASHWSDWYVGISDAQELEPAVGSSGSRRLMVGTPFPLTQRVAEDHLGRSEARWRSLPAGVAERANVSRFCELLILPTEQAWTYEARDSETEVTAVVELAVPGGFLDDPKDESAVERIEARCLEQSLANLKRFCEAGAARAGRVSDERH